MLSFLNEVKSLAPYSGVNGHRYQAGNFGYFIFNQVRPLYRVSNSFMD